MQALETISTTPKGFPIYSVDTAPEASKPTAQAIQGMFGVLPNLFGVAASSPALLNAQASLTKHQGETSLSPLEIQVIDLAVSRENECDYCLAAHTFFSRRLDQMVIQSVKAGVPLEDPKLEAVRRFAIDLVVRKGDVSREVVDLFHAAGYHFEKALDIVLVVGYKQMQNHINNLAATPIDPFLVS